MAEMERLFPLIPLQHSVIETRLLSLLVSAASISLISSLLVLSSLGKLFNVLPQLSKHRFDVLFHVRSHAHTLPPPLCVLASICLQKAGRAGPVYLLGSPCFSSLVFTTSPTVCLQLLECGVSAELAQQVEDNLERWIEEWQLSQHQQRALFKLLATQLKGAEQRCVGSSLGHQQTHGHSRVHPIPEPEEGRIVGDLGGGERKKGGKSTKTSKREVLCRDKRIVVSNP